MQLRVPVFPGMYSHEPDGSGVVVFDTRQLCARSHVRSRRERRPSWTSPGRTGMQRWYEQLPSGHLEAIQVWFSAT